MQIEGEENEVNYCIVGQKRSVHGRRIVERLGSIGHACTCFVQDSISTLRRMVNCAEMAG